MLKKSILIADDDKDMLTALSRWCKSLGLDVFTAVDGLQATALLYKHRPNLAILDIEMPGADGLSVCEQLARDEQTAAVPVIILTGRSDVEAIHACEAAGAYYVYKDMESWDKIKSILYTELDLEFAPEKVASKLRNRVKANSVSAPANTVQPKILVVEDDLRLLQAMKIRLSAYGAKVISAENGRHGFAVALSELPDVIVTDVTMPGGSGEYLLGSLKREPETRNIPVIVLTGRTYEGNEDVALKREMTGRGGAQAYFNKPVDLDLFIGELKKFVSFPRVRRQQQ